jgi:opacity protein-like surface antigen
MKRFVTYAGLAAMAVGVTILTPVTASAQTRPEFSVGYQVVHVPEVTFPVGWYADVSYPFVPMFNLVGEVSGAYKSENAFGVSVTEKLHTVMGGARFTSGMTSKAVPFAQVLIGFGKASGTVSGSGFNLGGSDTSFAFQLGGGVNVMASNRWGVRLGVDYRRISENEIRFAFGIVFPFSK